MRRSLLLLALAACAPRLSSTGSQAVTAAIARAPQPLGHDPDAPLTDLAGLRAILGHARLIGLGHPGSGARELTRLHHRLLRLLVEETADIGLALDVDATAALPLDAYVRGRDLDLDAALRGLGDRDLATLEMRALIVALRDWNAHHHRLRVFGLAPGDPDAAAALVLAYLQRVDPAYVPEARSLLAGPQLATDALLTRLDLRRSDYLTRADPDAFATARQHVELVAQARRMLETWEFEAGDFARARNAEWALAQLDSAAKLDSPKLDSPKLDSPKLGKLGKLVIFADNRRLAAEVPGPAPSTGNFLRQWFADDYRVIAASLLSGAVLTDHACFAALPPPSPHSLDAALLTAASIVLLDLRPPASELTRPQVLRTLLDARPDPTVLRPAIALDAVLGLRHVHPLTPLTGALAPCRPPAP